MTTDRNITPALMNSREAAAYMSVSVRTLYNLSASRGTSPAALPVICLPGTRTRRFKRTDLDALIARSSSGATGTPRLRSTG